MKTFKEFIAENQINTHAHQIIQALNSKDPYETMNKFDTLKASVVHSLYGKHLQDYGDNFEEQFKSTLRSDKERYDRHFKQQMENQTSDLLNNAEHNEHGQLKLYRIIHGDDAEKESIQREKEGKSQGTSWTWTQNGNAKFSHFTPAFKLPERRTLLTGYLPSIDHIDLDKTHALWLHPTNSSENEIRLHPTSRLLNLQRQPLLTKPRS